MFQKQSVPVAGYLRRHKKALRAGCGFSRLLKLCDPMFVLVSGVVLYLLLGMVASNGWNYTIRHAMDEIIHIRKRKGREGGM